MEFKKYLIDTFYFNDTVNKKVLEKIKQLPNKAEAVKLFSHIINCQHRWMAGILQDPQAKKTTWWELPYELSELESKWNDSLKRWIDYLNSKTDEQLSTEVVFIAFSGNDFAATPKNIALQLNYHSIHHRAQIQTIIRKQGLKPDSVEYINSHYREL